MPVPPLINDVFSITTEAIRKALHGRSQKQDIFGRIKMPTYEQQRKKELEIIKPINSSTPDWRIGGPTEPEFKNPGQRIERGLIIKDLVTF